MPPSRPCAVRQPSQAFSTAARRARTEAKPTAATYPRVIIRVSWPASIHPLLARRFENMLTYAAKATLEVVHGKGRVLARLGWVGVIGKGRVRLVSSPSWAGRGGGADNVPVANLAR